MERRSKANSLEDSDLGAYTFPVGVVVGFHALAGEVKIKPATNNLELLAELQTVKVEYPPARNLKHPADQILKIRQVRLDKRMVMVKFVGLDDRTAVEHLDGVRLLTRESELLPLAQEEFWVRDLVGLDAYTTAGALIGTISGIIPGATDLLEIKPPGRSDNKVILVPFIKTIVPHVDMRARRVEISNIEGLLEAQ